MKKNNMKERKVSYYDIMKCYIIYDSLYYCNDLLKQYEKQLMDEKK